MAMNIPPAQASTPRVDEGDWGHLPLEPCHYCRAVGGVYFLIDEGPEGRLGQQVVRCDLCRRSWVACSSSA